MKNLGLSAIVGIVIFACPLRAFAIDPTASVTAPASGSVFGGPAPYTVEGTASDTDGTVVSVRIAIENGTEYWDPSTETWAGSSTWVTSAYLTNGGDWATWSYAWNRPSHDSASVSITVEATDNDGNAWRDTVAATLDSQAPVVSSGVSFDFTPLSGNTGIDLSSSWSDAHTGTPEFQYTLNGAASGWSDSDAGASEFATKSYPGLPALDGNDLFDSIESRHTDAAGNGPTSSTAGPIYVQPKAPAASTVDNATPTTLDLTINETESGLGILYAIEVDGFQYVQAGGALGGSPVWQTLAAWGSPITLTGLSPETFYLFRTFAGNPSDGTPTPAENSQSTGFGSSSGTTTSAIPPSVSVTAPASGSVFGGPAPYTVEGTASDTDGTVVSVRVQIVKGAEYWDPSTETWAGSSKWVTSAYLTNGGDWATWSYAWNRPSHDSASVSITVEATDDDGAMGSDTVAATLDSQAPVVSSGVSFDFTPLSGNTGIDLSSSWSDAHTGTPEFQYTLNGAASGWSDSDAGASEFATKSYPGLPALDGNDLFDSIESRHTDAAGNGPTSSTAGPIYVQPKAPAASTVDNATPTTLDLTINETESGLGILYAIEVDGFQYVQAGGALGGSPVWQTLAAWGSPITLTGLSPETFYLFRTFAGNPSDGTPTPAENSQSTGFGSSSGTTTSAIPPSVSVTAPASGSVFGGPAPYTVEGTASDTDGTVVSVRVQIVKGAEYWDPSTETWAGSSKWVTSAYLTNGGDWATWSYAWNRPSHDSASVSITVEATDDDGAMGSDTVAATLDSQAPVVSSGVSFDFTPLSGNTGIDLSSSWSDAHTGTPEFQYTLNGAASGWSDSDAGASEFATKSYPGLPALDGNDLFDSIESRHTDAAGNGPTSSTAGPIYVQPKAPAASTVDNATPTTLDLTINETESGLGILYAIEVDGFQYVQAGGALGGSPVWQTLAAWGSPITLTGLSPETFYLFRTFAGNPSDGTPTPAENSQSTGFGSSSGTTTSAIPPSVSVTAPASGSVFGGPAPYTVEGTASDTDGTVVSVRVQIVKGAEYWDPSTETWAGSSKWVTSAYLTNGGDWATWSYAWNRPSHDSASVSITVEATDDDGAMGSDTVAATLDSQAPVVSSGVSFDFTPLSGNTGIDLSSSWSDAHTGTPEFQYTLNGAASGWSDSDAGASEFATKSYPGLPALDGNDLFDSIESRHTDAAGNGPTSSTAGPIYVQPKAPAASTVDNATPTTLDLTINETESGLGILYAIEVDGFQYVQAGGALGGSPVWQTLAAWGSPITLTGLSPETFYLFRTFAGNPSDGTPTPAENSQSTGFGSSSGTTTSAIPPSVSVTAPASGSVFGGPAPYTVEGTASDTDGTVVSVRVQIVKGAEYWDPSTETWAGSSKWVTSAYLTNGGDWATWSYAWNRPSHDSASVSITVEATDDDGAMGSDTVAATLDSQAPVVSSGVSFDFTPLSGNTGIDLSSSWSDAHTGTPEFQYTLNGAASGWSDSDAGASEFATKSYPGLPALDGNDLFDSIESRHTDAAGNGPTSSTAGPIYVQPKAPAASTVDNATPTTLDLTINETESGLGILYAIEVDGFQYVQAGGALGGSPVWQTLAAWGSPITLTGLSPETFYLFRTFAGNPSDGTPTPAENSQSTGFGSSSGTTTSAIPPSVAVPAIGPIGLGVLATLMLSMTMRKRR